MTGGDKLRASIRSLGLSRVRLWLIARFGETLLTEIVDGYDVRYIRWRGVEYALVHSVESSRDG